MNTTHTDPRRVLFVDDEEGVRVSWTRFLTDQGFDVSTAEDGARAISRLDRDPVDVVVADLRMPEVDGLELLEWLKDEQPQTRFILLTGYGDEEVERKARELGAYEYLNKPISPETLAAVITAASHLDLLPTERTAPELRAEPEVDVAETATEVEATEAAVVVEAPAEHRRLSNALKVVAGLVAAPILGLAFVLFLPVIGFAALFWVLGEALWKGTKPHEQGA